MVSIKRNMGLLFINFMMFVCFMGLYTISNAVVCTSSQAPCCKGTTMSCCPHPGYDSKGVELSYDLSGCMSVLPVDPDRPIIIGPIESECTSGQTQYQPKGDCGTSSRNCCSDGTWSDWDGECGASSSCGLNECWNGSKCVSKPSSVGCTCNNGTCSLSYACVSGSGWKSAKICTCDSGYQKNSSGECVHSTCAKGWCVGQYLREIPSGYNKGQCECCYPVGQSANGNITTHANCVEYATTPGFNKKCCRTTAYDGPTPIYYTLPSTFSSCSALGEAIQKPMYETTCPGNGSLL